MILKKKKIAVCSAQIPFLFGGAENLCNVLVQKLRERGYDVEHVMIPYKWYPNEQLINSMISWDLVDLTESNGEKIDLVIPTKFPSYMVQHDNKVVWLIHQYRQIYDLYGTKYSGLTEKDKPFIELVKQKDENALLHAKEIFCISDNVGKRLKKYNNIKGKTLYHPPMLYGRYFHEKYENYVLSVGRLDPTKRLDMLIKSFKYTENGIRLLIAGTGQERDNLERLSIQEGVSDKVSFLGFVNDEDLLKLYSNAGAVFFAPFDEDYGYITLEAFLSKVPIISTTDSGGILEFAEDGKNSYITNPEPEEIGNAINKIILNKKIAQEFGERGYEKVKNISWNNVIDKLTETLR